MDRRTCVMWMLLTLARGEEYASSPPGLVYNPSPPSPGYTSTTPRPAYTPQVTSSSKSQKNPTASYSGPTPAPYTAVASTSSTLSTTTPATPSADALGNTELSFNDFSHPCASFSGRYSYFLPEQVPPYFISQYYKQPPYYYHQPQPPYSLSYSLSPPLFQGPSKSPPNSLLYHRHAQPQSAVFQVSNPMSLLGGFAPRASLRTMAYSRGPPPTPGYYSPTLPPPQPLFRSTYTTAAPYGVP